MASSSIFRWKQLSRFPKRRLQHVYLVFSVILCILHIGVCVYIYIYVSVYVYVCAYAYAYVYVNVCVYAYVICICKCKCICIHTHLCLHAWMDGWMDGWVYVCTCTCNRFSYFPMYVFRFFMCIYMRFVYLML